MKRTILLSAAICAGVTQLFGDVIVGPGQTWSFAFSDIPFVGTGLPSSSIGGASMAILRFTTDPGVQSSYYVEMFRNSLADPSIVQGHLNDYSTPGMCYVGGYQIWNDDFQGWIRLHVTAGQLRINEVVVSVWNNRVADGQLSQYQLVSAVNRPILRYRLTTSTSGAVQAVLSWPTGATAYKLQSTQAINSDLWLDSTQPVTVVDGEWSVVLDADAGQRFFRLENR